MATSTYLSNPVVTVNSVALTGFCTSAVFERVQESIEVTSFGETSRTYNTGLANNTLTLTLYMTYGASEVFATLKGLVGTQTTVQVKPNSGAGSATNPNLILTNCYLESLPVMNASLGERSQIDVVFTGGVFSETTTP